MDEPVNVLGEPLQTCSDSPVTGFFRDGCCNTGDQDFGSHTVCVNMAARVVLQGTHQRALEIVPLDVLRKFAVDLS